MFFRKNRLNPLAIQRARKRRLSHKPENKVTNNPSQTVQAKHQFKSSTNPFAVFQANHFIQPKLGTQAPVIQLERKLNPQESEACLKQVEKHIQELEQMVAQAKDTLPTYIVEAVSILRKKKDKGKIICYAFEGKKHGRYKDGEIHVEGLEKDAININVVLHEGVHALHGEKHARLAKEYSAKEGEKLERHPKNIHLLKWKAYTEYWAYRSRYDLHQPHKDKEELHRELLKDKNVILHIMRVWRLEQDLPADQRFDPRTWIPAK